MLLREMAQDRLVAVSPSAPVFCRPTACGLQGPRRRAFRRSGASGARDGKAHPVAAAATRARPRPRSARAHPDPDERRYRRLRLLRHRGQSATARRWKSAPRASPHAPSRSTHSVGADQSQRMRDASTAAQVRAACHAHPKLGHAPIDVVCTQGAVQVRGPGLVPPWDELANQVASQVEGVRSVAVRSRRAADSSLAAPIDRAARLQDRRLLCAQADTFPGDRILQRLCAVRSRHRRLGGRTDAGVGRHGAAGASVCRLGALALIAALFAVGCWLSERAEEASRSARQLAYRD